jgi:hypothetical protein
MVEFRDSYGILKLMAAKSSEDDFEDITGDSYRMALRKNPDPILRQLFLTIILVAVISIFLRVNLDQNAFLNKNNQPLFAIRVVAARSLQV